MPVRRLRDGTGDAGRTKVLEAFHEPALDQFQAGLDEEFLGERITHLDGGTLGGARLVERGAGEDARPADAIATGGRAEQDDRVAGAGRRSARQVALLQEPHGHHVDQRVLAITGVEDEFAADRRHAHAVAVAAHAVDDAAHEVAGPFVGRIAELQGVEDGDGAGPHGEDVAQDAAHPGGCALVRLDRAGVVVRFELEGHGETVADADDPGVLALAGHHPAAGAGQTSQPRARALVGAVLAPHDAEHGQFQVVGRTTQAGPDGHQLLVGQAEGAVERRGQVAGGHGRLHDRHAAALARALPTSERSSSSPSAEPRSASAARSGWGIRPHTLPRRSITPAMSRADPLGLPSGGA